MQKVLSWHTKMIDNNVAECPDCGGALHLYNRPINVRFYKCSACDAEFSTEYMRGYWDGKTRDAEQHVHTDEQGQICPLCKNSLLYLEDNTVVCGNGFCDWTGQINPAPVRG